MPRLRFGSSPFLVVILSLLVSPLPSASAQQPTDAKVDKYLVYVGTYTGNGSKGIYLCQLDAVSGALTSLGLAAETENPSFLALHPNRTFLYAVNEVGNFGGKSTGGLSAFSIGKASGKLTLLNQQPSEGTDPCHLVLDHAGKHLLVANYGSGSAASVAIRDDGRLGSAISVIRHQGSSVNPTRQQGPHAHSINLDAANRFAFVADLGLDKVLIYRFDAATGSLAPNDPPSVSVAPGSGPRHFAFHPSGQYAYVINEMLSTVTAFKYDAERGVLTEIQTVPTLPADFKGTSTTAEVQVHPSGKFLYGSNRGHDSLAIFTIAADSGRLTPAGFQPTGGKTPRNFGIDPSGNWILAANQASNNITVFRVDPQTGALRQTGNSLEVPSPVCVKMMPAAR